MNRLFLLLTVSLLMTSCDDLRPYNCRRECDSKNCISIIEYFPYVNSDTRGIYITPEDCGRIPKYNFIQAEYSELPIFVGSFGDTLRMILDGWNVIQISNSEPKFDFRSSFSREDLIKYHFYDDRENFYNYLKEDFIIYYLD